MSKKLWNTFISKAIKKSISEANIAKTRYTKRFVVKEDKKILLFKIFL